MIKQENENPEQLQKGGAQHKFHNLLNTGRHCTMLMCDKSRSATKAELLS